MASDLIVEPLDATFGARVTGMDLSDLDERTWTDLYDVWIKHGLIVAPGQFLSADAQVGLAKRFGEIELIGDKEIVALSNIKADGSVRGDDGMTKILKGNMGWHADSTYMPLQAKGAVFTAEVVPPEGGGTAWADMRAAYDTLDDVTRAKVEQLSAHHSLTYSQSKAGFDHAAGDGYSGYGFEGHAAPLRPLVKVHPVTGRPSLTIGRHAHAIPGMDPDESEQFLTGLLEAACQPPRIYEHQWSPGDAVVWDNRCLLHRAIPWDMSQPRVMWHSRIAGDRSSELVEM